MADFVKGALLRRPVLNPMSSSTLEGIWCCSEGFHTDGLIDEGVVPVVDLLANERNQGTGERLRGQFGPLRQYHCTIHQEKVHFALTSVT